MSVPGAGLGVLDLRRCELCGVAVASWWAHPAGGQACTPCLQAMHGVAAVGRRLAAG